MRLYSNPMSPYGRKVMVVIHELGLSGRVMLVDTQPRARPEEAIAVSPVGKIPVLVTDDGLTIRDSPVQAEYLCAEFGGEHLLPSRGRERWRILTAVADADAVLEAAILVRNERLRPAEQQSADFIAWHLDKVRRTLAAFEADVAAGAPYDLGAIAIGCVASYVPRRLTEYEGLATFPRLAAFHASLLERPAFAQTEPG